MSRTWCENASATGSSAASATAEACRAVRSGPRNPSTGSDPPEPRPLLARLGSDGPGLRARRACGQPLEQRLRLGAAAECDGALSELPGALVVGAAREPQLRERTRRLGVAGLV